MWNMCLGLSGSVSSERGTALSGTGLRERSRLIFPSLFHILEEYRSVSRVELVP